MSAVNVEILKSFIGDDETMLKHFVDLFKSEMPSQLAEIVAAIKASDWSTVSVLAHSVKSQVQYLGLTKTYKTAYRIEVMTQNMEDLSNIGPLYISLRDDITKAISDIDLIEL